MSTKSIPPTQSADIKLDLGPVSVPKAADILAGILREKILGGQLSEGVNLPNERELGSQAGLSRASVREALRILAGEGLITTSIGRNGGSQVVRLNSATIERSVVSFIRGRRIRMETVLETRAVIEPSAARFAALKHTDEDLRKIKACHAELEQTSLANDIPAYVRANLDWHVQVVHASHNELLIAFIAAISQSIYAATDLDGFNSVEVRNAVIQVHRSVVDAIQARDGDAAARRMSRHVTAYISSVQHTSHLKSHLEN